MLRLVALLAALSPAPSKAAPLPLPPASMTLDVTPQPGGLLQLVVTNRGEETVRFAADARLLRLFVTPKEEEAPARGKPKPKKVIECQLPTDFRPTDVRHDRAALLDPGERWEEVFDPLLYCFGQKEREALVEGAEIVVKLGFPAPALKTGSKAKPLQPPYVVEPTKPDASVLALKELEAAPITLLHPLEAKPSSADPPASTDPRDPGAPALAVSTPALLDAKSERGIVLGTTLRNAGARPMRVHLRRDQLWFDVEGPTGLFRCGPSDALRATPPDFFATLSPGKSRTFSVQLMEMCPTGTFARPGLYRVRAGVLVTNDVGGQALGAWTGTAVSPSVTFVRVRTGDGPFYVTPPKVTAKEGVTSSDTEAH